MRICAPVTSLSEHTDLGGGYFHVKNLEGLADRGVQCLIPLAFRTDFSPRDNWNVRVIPLRRTFKLGALLSNIVFFLAVLWFRYVRGERFDLVRVGDLYHVGVGALWAARLCGVPAVGMIHHVDDDRPRENAVIGYVARRLDGITVPSRSTAEHTQRAFGVQADRLHLITEGATTFAEKAPGKAAAKKQFGLGNARVVGFLGRLDKRKNVSLLLDAFAQVAQENRETKLLVVGDGPERANLEGQARTLGVDSRVVFAGRVFQQDKQAALQAMDVFAFPSLMEGFGLAVAEAMIAGVPVVVSDRGSLPELVRDGKTGRVTTVNNAEPMAAAIAELLDDADLRRKLGAAGKHHAEKHFTWAACAEQTEAAYRAVLASEEETHLGVLLNSGDSLAVMRREGQVERFVDHYLRRYDEAFDQVSVFSYGKDDQQFYGNTVFVPGEHSWKGPVYAALMPLLYRRVFRQLTLLRVMQAGAALPAVIACVLYGTPYVVTYGYRYGDFMRIKGRKMYGRWLDVLEKIALRLAVKVIVTTPSLREHVATLCDADKIAMLPNGVDLSAFKPARRSTKQDKATALFIGRLTEQKNLPLAVRALAPLRERVRLVCVGGGEQAATVQRLAAELNLDLELTGVVAHTELPAQLQRADLFVLPSIIEGHPKALIEAMAAGLPCVGTRAPGIVDVLTDGVDGLLVESNEDDFRAAVQRLLDDPALVRRLGKQARVTAQERYDLSALLTREIELLQEAGRCRG